jgi:hypothetical protein
MYIKFRSTLGALNTKTYTPRSGDYVSIDDAKQVSAGDPVVVRNIYTEKKAITSAPTGTSAGEVLTGVGSILAALAPAATTAFQAQAEARAARTALKRERQQQMPMYTGPMQPQIIQQGPSTGLILGIAGGIAAIALILILVLKK